MQINRASPGLAVGGAGQPRRTFSDTLANALRTQLRRLIHHEPRLAERLEVHSINAIGLRLFKSHFGAPQIASHEALVSALKATAGEVEGRKFSPHFLLTEWDRSSMRGSWTRSRIATSGVWVERPGLPEAQRAILWSIFEKVRDTATTPAAFSPLRRAGPRGRIV